MNPISKDRIREIFSMVKFLIKTREESYLCFALEKLNEKSLITFYEKNYLRKKIEDSIKGSSTVITWLEKYHPESLKEIQINFPENTIGFQAYRLAWCDAIIERGYI